MLNPPMPEIGRGTDFTAQLSHICHAGLNDQHDVKDTSDFTGVLATDVPNSCEKDIFSKCPYWLWRVKGLGCLKSLAWTSRCSTCRPATDDIGSMLLYTGFTSIPMEEAMDAWSWGSSLIFCYMQLSGHVSRPATHERIRQAISR